MNTEQNLNEPESAILSLADGDVENIWVRKLDGNRCEVLTIPFWAYNLSRGDLVECHPDEDGIGLFIEKVLEKSGNKTIRIAFQGKEGIDHPEARKLIDFFKEHNLLFEIFEPRLFSVNIPSELEYQQLIKRLEAVPNEAEVIWEEGDPNPRKNLDRSEVIRSEDSK